jgi:hypothetical protein
MEIELMEKVMEEEESKKMTNEEFWFGAYVASLGGMTAKDAARQADAATLQYELSSRGIKIELAGRMKG